MTAAAAVALAVLLGLGTWQVQRLQWKTALLERIETARTAPPVTLAAAGRDPTWIRVRLDCRRFRDGRALYGLQDGQIVWRLLSLCDAASGPVVLDRGIIVGSEGRVSPPEPPRLETGSAVVGVVRPSDGSVAQAVRAAGWPEVRWYVAADAETPASDAVRPAPLPTALSNNHLGYAITWYGLAAALIGVYVALLRKRLKP